jgi:MFS family permease
VPSLAYALFLVGTGVGGIGMGWWADRRSVMRPALLGSAMIGAGCIVASLGGAVELALGYGLLIGLLGNAATLAPMAAYVSRWFDRRCGTALALLASGQSIAGVLCPPLFRYTIDGFGWRATLAGYGAFVLATMLPLCLLLRRTPPQPLAAWDRLRPHADGAVLGLPGNLVLAVISAAIVCCCTAMSMPMGHLVAFCSDLGFAPARGAEMLGVLFAAALLSRLLWGPVADRLGGLMTILLGSACQALFLSCYLFIDGLVGLYLVSAAFGLGFGGIVPSYLLAVRQLYPAAEAGWRIAVVVLFGFAGMALGGWLGGFIYDRTADYHPAFAAALAFNLLNLLIIGWLAFRRSGTGATARAMQPG